MKRACLGILQIFLSQTASWMMPSVPPQMRLHRTTRGCCPMHRNYSNRCYPPTLLMLPNPGQVLPSSAVFICCEAVEQPHFVSRAQVF